MTLQNLYVARGRVMSMKRMRQQLRLLPRKSGGSLQKKMVKPRRRPNELRLTLCELACVWRHPVPLGWVEAVPYVRTQEGEVYSKR